VRVDAGLSQEELAERARVSAQAIGSYERGTRRAPHRDTLIAIVDALKLEPRARDDLVAAAEEGRRRGPVAASGSATRAIEAARHNLPTHPTSFVGRQNEIVQIAALLDSHRLVTVVGPAGVGKSRTAVEVARTVPDQFADGLWLIELAPLDSAEHIPVALARTIGVRVDGADVFGAVVGALKAARALLILDNCEHLVPQAAEMISALRDACVQLKLVATSRHALGIDGEKRFDMPALSAHAAVTLFAERAAATDQRFSLDTDNREIVSEICRRLDRLPLAIELAAARVRVLSPKQLHARLHDRLRLLTRSRTDVALRQRSLLAAIDWSHGLLDADEQMLFRRLSVAAGGCTLEGAAALVADKLSEIEALDVVESLVDKSLLTAKPARDAVRYQFLESIRAYACEKLDESGERTESFARFVRYLREAFVDRRTLLEETANWMPLNELLSDEGDNVRSALAWALEGDVRAGFELAAAIGSVWKHIGLANEGLTWIHRFLPLVPDRDSGLAARLWIGVSSIQSAVRPEALATSVSEAVRQARASGDAGLLSIALTWNAVSLCQKHDGAAAAAVLSEAEAVAPPQLVSVRLMMLSTKAYVEWLNGNLDGAAKAYEQLIEGRLAVGNTDAAATATTSLAEMEHERGRTEHAARVIAGAISYLRTGRDRRSLVVALANLIGYSLALDRLAEARAAAVEALRESLMLDGDSYPPFWALEHFALLLALEGDCVRAAVLEGCAQSAFARLGYTREFTEKTTYGRLGAVLREHLDDAEIARLAERGSGLKPADAIALALEETKAAAAQ
jgi:predicted ATPase/transcriptional regulator with XRE-family HTH domain